MSELASEPLSAAAAQHVDGGWHTEVLLRYEHALWTQGALRVQDESGRLLPFDTVRWSSAADAADETLLRRCVGPTLDVGCGPGRLVAALAARSIPALGVDVAATAIAITRARGAVALRRSVFDALPGAGRWSTALLADGNIGIGGDVGRLLTRLRELLARQGRLLVEVDPSAGEDRVTAQVTDQGGTVIGSFPWVRIGAEALQDIAIACGFTPVEEWTSNGRQFLHMRRD